MIIGTGIDITEIKRIENALLKGDFLGRFFTENEAEYFATKKNSAESVAGAFCSKEAFSKALGTGIRNFNLKDIEVLHTELGKPYIKLHKNAKDICESMGVKNIFLSISHSDAYAIANVILEGDK